MTALRKRLVEDLKLAGYADSTQESYVRVIGQLSKHYNRSPDLLSEDEVRRYLLHIRDVRKRARSSLKVAQSALKFFFEKSLQREWGVFVIARPPRQSRLPVVLSRGEVRQVLAAVRKDTYRTCLTTIYACGLRLGEGMTLRVDDIDSARMVVHVRNGKGGRDRDVPLSRGLLQLLREEWKVHRSREWLFPWCKGSGDAPVPISRGGLQRAVRLAVASCGIRKKAHIHTLRHCYATHLLEAGVSIRLIQAYLGHRSARSTAIYTHLTREVHRSAVAPIDRLMDGL